MKKLLILLALLLAAPAAGQTVGASQLKRKTNGGTAADSNNALYVSVYRGTSAPATPLTGQFWCDTNYTPCLLKTYNGSTWDGPGAVTILTQDNLSAFPANPVDGQISWVENQKRAIVYSSADAKWYYLDAKGREVASDYILGSAYPTDFIATGATTGTVTSGGSVTAGTHLCATTFYNANGGETMPGTATGTLTSGSPNQTLSLTIPTGGTGTTGRKVYCSKANTATPLFYVDRVADNSTTTYAVTVADGSFSTHTAPDDDFSASIPTGFSYRVKDAGLDGCGSTGESVLCYSQSVTNTSGSISAWGPRLEYAISGNPEDWVARWHVTRWDRGFAGRTSSCIGNSNSPYLNNGLASVMATDANVPTTYGWGVFNSTTSSTLPFTPVLTPLANTWTRTAGAAPTGGSSSAFGHNAYPPIQSQDFYIVLRGHWEDPNWTYQLKGGPLQNETGPWYNTTAPDSSATWCEGGFCGTTEMTRIGIVHMERVAHANSTCAFQIYEIKDFTFTAE